MENGAIIMQVISKCNKMEVYIHELTPFKSLISPTVPPPQVSVNPYPCTTGTPKAL
jgi:hypothetical protein